MPDHQRCETCGVLDALDRHAATCEYAVRIGLPRLAEGEEPIDPVETERWSEEHATAAEAAAAGDETALEAIAMSELPPLDDQPGRIEQTPDGLRTASYGVGYEPASAFWFSYPAEPDGSFSDAIVFATELDALRHAVANGGRVHRLTLGQSLREQVEAV